ncbi:S8 family serine peptidase [Bacillus timonensis]|nr:S8 family serine peptidase [Bacillus timonensis]
MRKSLAIFLAVVMVLSNASFVLGANNQQVQNTELAKIREQIQKERKMFEDAENLKASLSDDDIVRVVVEAKGETPVEAATKKGVMYKELSKAEKDSLEAVSVKKQKDIKSALKAKGIKIKYHHDYSTSFIGFSGEVKVKDIELIESLSGVKNVYIANEYNMPEPEMKTSHQFVQSYQTWADAGYKGEGMVVAVLDTGSDPLHKDFVITDSSTVGLTEAEVNTIIAEQGIKGKYFNTKVPFGYNYYDKNNTIRAEGGVSEHGMHVAGTVAANGDTKNGGIQGVAPEAQVLVMKVFGNDPNFVSTFSDIYLAAIDDSVKLGADVVNMSLGSTAAFYEPNSPEDVAISRAVDNGIVVAVSAGNSGHIGNGWDNPFYNNPDIGVVGSPGLNKDTLQVAASGNLLNLYQHQIGLTNSTYSGVGYGIDSWEDLGTAEIVSLAQLNGKTETTGSSCKACGRTTDYENVDVAGKVVLVKRGALSFYDKTMNAAAAGAVGIIVYDHGLAGFYDNQGGWAVPFMMVSVADGDALAAEVAAGNSSLEVSYLTHTEGPEVGRMTDFTSWGTTPSLELKPEITAPGGGILSTLQDNQYGTMSGTSMAAPHVAGGAALVQQFLKATYPDLGLSERTRLAKKLLMNTAYVIDDLNGQPFSPRRQGAGMMQTFAAVSSPVYVVEKHSTEAKVELKDFTETVFTMDFTATNMTDEEVTYNVNVNALTDTFEEAGEFVYNALIAGDLEGTVFDAPATVTVPANGSVDFSVTVDFTNAVVPGFDAEGNAITKELAEDIFVEGFVTLEHADALKPALSVPYVGFYGDWTRPDIVDGLATLGEQKYYDAGFPSDMLEGSGYFVGAVEHGDGIVFPLSPNGDGFYDNIYPLPAFLRSSKELQFNVLDENMNFLRRVKFETFVRKTYYDRGRGSYYSFDTSRAWNGKVNKKLVQDGLYYYEIKGMVDYPGALWQAKHIPVYVDTTAPVVTTSYDDATNTLSWNVVEDGIGYGSVYVFIDGELVTELDKETTTFVVDLTTTSEQPILEVVVVDAAENLGVSKPLVVNDDTLPVLYLDNPTVYGYYDTRTVPVSGYVVEDFILDTITVNGVEAEFELVDGAYEFEAEAVFESDGQKDVIVTATDLAGNEYSVNRRVFVDTTPAVVEIDAPESVLYGDATVDVTVHMSDNLNFLSLYQSDSHLVQFSTSEDFLDAPISKTHTVTLNLAHGDNTFEFTVVDLVGNETVKEITIHRPDTLKTGWVEEDGKTYYYNELGVKQTGWVEVEGKKYYLNAETGVQVTGWVKLDGTWFYLNPTTGEMKTGWVKDAGKWYFLNDSGKMQTGWVKDGGKWYFLSASGEMKTGWVKDGGQWYFLSGNGAMKTGWLWNGGAWYYLNNNGSMHVGWKFVGGKWYNFASNGKLLK